LNSCHVSVCGDFRRGSLRERSGNHPAHRGFDGSLRSSGSIHAAAASVAGFAPSTSLMLTLVIICVGRGERSRSSQAGEQHRNAHHSGGASPVWGRRRYRGEMSERRRAVSKQSRARTRADRGAGGAGVKQVSLKLNQRIDDQSRCRRGRSSSSSCDLVAQARENGIELVGPDGLLTSLTNWVWAFPCGKHGVSTAGVLHSQPDGG
jgi:hypothetical protein